MDWNIPERMSSPPKNNIFAFLIAATTLNNNKEGGVAGEHLSFVSCYSSSWKQPRLDDIIITGRTNTSIGRPSNVNLLPDVLIGGSPGWSKSPVARLRSREPGISNHFDHFQPWIIEKKRDAIPKGTSNRAIFNRWIKGGADVTSSAPVNDISARHWIFDTGVICCLRYCCCCCCCCCCCWVYRSNLSLLWRYLCQSTCPWWLPSFWNCYLNCAGVLSSLLPLRCRHHLRHQQRCQINRNWPRFFLFCLLFSLIFFLWPSKNSTHFIELKEREKKIPIAIFSFISIQRI